MMRKSGGKDRFLRSFGTLSFVAVLMSAAIAFGQFSKPAQPDLSNEPNTKPAHHHAISTKDLQEKLQKGLDNKNAAYTGSNIQTAVDDQNVTLTGTVTSSMQHEMALQLVRAYSEDRKIVDRLTIQQ
jgi:hypothetical protein